MVRQSVLMMLTPLLLAGCATRGDDPYADLIPARQAVGELPGRQCQYIAEPLVPATIDEMTRPGTRGAMLFWARDALPSDTLELSVRYGVDGDLAWVRAIRTTMAPDRVAELERIVSAGLSGEGPADWGMRLLVVGGHIDTILPAVVCRASLERRIGDVMQPVGSPQQLAAIRRARGRQIEMRVSLDADGRVMNVSLARSSGSRLLDQYAIDLARAYRYHPKLHDGIGVPTTLPVRIRIPRR